MEQDPAYQQFVKESLNDVTLINWHSQNLSKKYENYPENKKKKLGNLNRNLQVVLTGRGHFTGKGILNII